MPLPAPTPDLDDEATAAPVPAAPDVHAAEDETTTAAEHIADLGLSSTIAIELNFNAFADHVPPDKHAKRVARIDDPSVQDFADQALELAALRAELKRLHHEYDNLQNAVRLRDTWLKTLREELAAVQAQLRDAQRAATLDAVADADREADSSPPVAPAATPHTQVLPKAMAVAAHDLTSTLDVTAARETGSATLTGAAFTTHTPPSHERRFVPVDHDGPAVTLKRDIMTIGRTREHDICIPSRAVSRDHARLLIGPVSVTLVDMNSANGCFVNDEPVRRQKLRDGDIVRIGDRSFRFSNPVQPGDQSRDTP